MITLSRVFHENREAFKSNYRYIINQGGTSSTKTFSILQLLTDIIRKKDYKIDILGLSVPHLKQGVLNDMSYVCNDFGLNFDEHYRSSEKEFKLKGSINFLSVDKLGKAHGGRRDILYINEANHSSWKIAEQLIIRTKLAIFIDYNPTSEFWAHKQLMKESNDYKLIKSTYRDNPRLSSNIVKAIEAKKGDNNFWRVYGLGEMGRAEGLIYEDFETECDFDKESFEHYRHGVDWGFSVDPFCYLRIAIDFNNMIIYICDELYGKNLQNTETAPEVIKLANGDVVFCDNAEPKSISEYQSLGVNAEGAKKGAGSIESGIKYLQRYKIKVHHSCYNTAVELNNYSWKMNRVTGEPLNIPDDNFNHCLDALRYAVNVDIDGGGYAPSVSFF